MAVQIHPTAIVAAGAELADGVELGAYSIIGAHVKIGAGSKIGPHAVIDGHTELGPENTVSPFASIGGAPQDLKFKGEPSTVTIGAKNVIREYVTINPGTAHGTMATIIGDQNLFMVSSHVAHDCRVGSRNVFANAATLAGHVEIGNGVILGGLVAIHQFVRIGDLAFLGGGSMINLDIPPFAMVQGDRAKLRGLNVIGLRRAGFSASDLRAVKRTYRTLFWRGGSMEKKLALLSEDDRALPVVQQILTFAAGTTRGFVHPRRGFSAAPIESDEVD